MVELKKSLGPVQFFSIGFGTIVGVGWIVYMGLWFEQAGPAGTAVAFLVGGLMMSLIGLCYAEAAAMYPVAGGEMNYAYAAFGPKLGFAVGWALVLMMTAVVPYVSVSLAWILEALFPGISGPTLYSWRGQPIQLTALLIAGGYTLWLGLLNYRGIRGAARFQDWMTYGKIAVSLLFVGAGLFWGSAANLTPAFQRNAAGSIWPGFFAVLATTPWFFGGFNSVPQVLEERTSSTTPRVLGAVIVATVLASGAYYAVAALATGMAGPWAAIVKADLPAAAAFRALDSTELLARAVLLVGLLGVLTVGNGAVLSASRNLFALGRARMVTPAFTALHPVFGSPKTAIVFITVFGLLGNLLGRRGIGPIVNVGAAAASFAYLVTTLSIWRLRVTAPDRPRPFRLPSVAIAVVSSLGALVLLLAALRQNWVDAGGGVPLEWGVIAVWGLIGAVLWNRAQGARAALGQREQRRLVLGDEG
ncbi:MAG: APC family permease [Gemmatimonadetes bacterium]|nr:APC family permease [Gemmatimonadota bacterium]